MLTVLRPRNRDGGTPGSWSLLAERGFARGGEGRVVATAAKPAGATEDGRKGSPARGSWPASYGAAFAMGAE